MSSILKESLPDVRGVFHQRGRPPESWEFPLGATLPAASPASAALRAQLLQQLFRAVSHLHLGPKVLGDPDLVGREPAAWRQGEPAGGRRNGSIWILIDITGGVTRSTAVGGFSVEDQWKIPQRTSSRYLVWCTSTINRTLHNILRHMTRYPTLHGVCYDQAEDEWMTYRTNQLPRC